MKEMLALEAEFAKAGQENTILLAQEESLQKAIVRAGQSRAFLHKIAPLVHAYSVAKSTTISARATRDAGVAKPVRASDEPLDAVPMNSVERERIMRQQTDAVVDAVRAELAAAIRLADALTEYGGG